MKSGNGNVNTHLINQAVTDVRLGNVEQIHDGGISAIRSLRAEEKNFDSMKNQGRAKMYFFTHSPHWMYHTGNSGRMEIEIA